MATAPTVPTIAPLPTHESFIQKIEGAFHKDAHAVETALTVAAKDFAKGLTFLVRYLPEAGALATLIFPTAGPAIATATNVTDLIQKAVLAAEAQYAAAGINTEAGAAKSADVITLVESTALPLIKQLEPDASTERIQAIIDAVVAILKVRPVTATPADTSGAAPTAA